MTEQATIDAPRNAEAQRPVTRRDLVEGKVDRILSDKMGDVGMGAKIGGLKLDDMLKAVDAAKLMATSGSFLPPWLQGNVGGCWSILLYAAEFGISPITLARWTYEVENRGVKQVAFESQFYHAIIEIRAPIKEGLRARYEGSGDKRKCFVYATAEGEEVERVWPPLDSGDEFTLGKLRPPRNEYGKIKGSPLWDSKPDLQLFYAMSRDWARMNFPHVIAGLPAEDEVLADRLPNFGPERARDISPSLRERLRGPRGEGFVSGDAIASHIDSAIARARDASESATPVAEVPTAARHQPAAGADAAATDTPAAVASAPQSSDLPATTSPDLAAGDGAASGAPIVGVASSTMRSSNEELPTPRPDAADQSMFEEPPPPSEAFKEGFQAFALHIKKRAVPGPYRSKDNKTLSPEAKDWMDGWQAAEEAKKAGR